MSNVLLVPESPLQVLPTLATRVGLKEAILLQQLHYWTLKMRPEEGWISNTAEEWQEQFPFLTERTLKRAWKSLREQGLIEVKRGGGDGNQRFYRVIYDRLPRVDFATGHIGPSGGATGQNGPDEGPDCPVVHITETTQRTPQPPKGGQRVGKKVDRKPVTEAEYSLASAIVDAFNEIAGTSLGVDPHLTPIVGRIRERPSISAEQHRKIIEAVFAGEHWWTGPPGPRVIYGNAAQFEQSIEVARQLAAGEQVSKPDPLSGEALRRKIAREEAEELAASHG